MGEAECLFSRRLCSCPFIDVCRMSATIDLDAIVSYTGRPPYKPDIAASELDGTRKLPRPQLDVSFSCVTAGAA